jgi:flagellar hook-associated protein 1
MGVDVTAVSRLREGYLDVRARATGAGAAYAGARADLLGQSEALMGEPDAGIQQALVAVHDAFDDLALEPGSFALRDAALGALDSMARRMRDVAASWNVFAEAGRVDIDATLAQANQMLARVGELNTDIVRSNGSSNAALDERDMLIDRLSRLIGATSEAQPDDAIHVLLDGQRLVQTQTAPAVRTLSYDTATGVHVGTPDTVVTAGGAVGGIQAFLSGTCRPCVRSSTSSPWTSGMRSTRRTAWVRHPTPAGRPGPTAAHRCSRRAEPTTSR